MSSNQMNKSRSTTSLIPPILLLLSLQLLPHVRSQAPPPPGYYADFNPSIITIIVILIAALFLMAFFTVYIRRRSDDGGISIRRVLSMRRATAAPRGLDPSVIETFPTFVYSTVKAHKIGKGALECAVCLNEYEDEETLRLIPKCDHVFHPECIDAWFESHVTCPVCRANLVPDSGESGGGTGGGTGELGFGDAGGESQRPDAVGDGNRNEVVSDSVSITVNEDSAVNVPAPATETETVNRPPIFPKLFNKFRSHSTGHSLVQPGENLDRFTLRLPADVRKQVVNRALLNPRMVGEGSGKNGYRTGGSVSGRRKSYKRLESLDRVVVRSERWVMSRAPSFLSRALSIRSPRVLFGNGEASSSSALTPKGSRSTTPKGSKSTTPTDKIPLNIIGPKSC